MEEKNKISYEQLEAENRMFRMILEALPVNLFVKDTQCKYRITSRICDLINGVERGGLNGKTDFDLQSSKEIAQAFFDDDQNIMVTKKGSRMLSPTTCTGKLQYYDIYKEPLVDEEGTVQGILGLVVLPGEVDGDAAAVVEKASEKQVLFEDIDCVMFDYNLKTGKASIFKSNSKFEIQEDKTQRFEEAFAKQLGEKTGEAFLKAFTCFLQDQDPLIFLFDGKGTDGEMHTFVLNMEKILHSKVTAEHAYGVIDMLHEETKLKEEMALSLNMLNNRLLKVLSQKSDTVLYLNRRNGNYAGMGKELAGIRMGGSLEEMRQAYRQFVHEEDLELLEKHIDEKREEQSSSIEIRLMSKGKYRWYNVEFYRIEDIDHIHRDLIILITDIDEIVTLRRENEVRMTNNQLIDVLSSVVESRDLESGNHIQRIRDVTHLLLKGIMENHPEYGLTKAEIDVISAASAMHDIGKVAIPDQILLKPGRLTPDEFELMKQHTLRGCEIIDSASAIQNEEYYKYCYDICRHHHERYDGNGYPDRLAGDEISIAAQVVSLADVYDALINKRCYKDAYPEQQVFDMILNGECGIFNPKIIHVFKKLRLELKRVYLL